MSELSVERMQELALWLTIHAEKGHVGLDSDQARLAAQALNAHHALAAERDALRQAGLDLLAALQVLERHALPMLAIHGDLLPPEVLAYYSPKVKAARALLAPAGGAG